MATLKILYSRILIMPRRLRISWLASEQDLNPHRPRIQAQEREQGIIHRVHSKAMLHTNRVMPWRHWDHPPADDIYPGIRQVIAPGQALLGDLLEGAAIRRELDADLHEGEAEGICALITIVVAVKIHKEGRRATRPNGTNGTLRNGLPTGAQCPGLAGRVRWTYHLVLRQALRHEIRDKNPLEALRLVVCSPYNGGSEHHQRQNT